MVRTVKRVCVRTEGVYSSLNNFLPAGTITSTLPDSPHSFTEHGALAEDGWHVFPQAVSGFRDETALDKISFLARNRFISATYHVDPAHLQLFVRIYIIPWDLAGSRGELRLRCAKTVLEPGTKHLKQLLLRVRQDRSLWDGSVASSSNPQFLMNQAADNRTLLDIYNALPSPSAHPIEKEIPGLRTQLYEYQRRSVATMVARETGGGSVEHPLYVPIKGVNGKVFFMQPATMEILSEPPRVSAVPGGILCEELGTGKTVMILSLILATLDQLSAPDEGIHEERNPLTPIAFQKFRTEAALSEREKLSGGGPRKKRKTTTGDGGFPTLVDILLHKCRVAPEGIPLRDPTQQERMEGHSLLRPLMANVPFYLQTHDLEETSGRRARQQGAKGPKVMYLTSATLVIVPDNLRRQWANEILKHCTDLLRVLLVDDKHELPDATTLASDYDIVLMSQSRFSQESKKRNIESLYSWTVCECEQRDDLFTMERCRCNRRKGVSPLLQVRWKRLVVDEGHNTAERWTEYAIFTKLLSVERRWIVTGTPTTNLLGLNFGSGNELQHPEDDDGCEREICGERVYVEEQRIWHSAERTDLRKLGNMLSDFLMMMPFKSDSKAFSSLVTDPIFSRIGPYPGDIDVLVQVMSTVMVRHRIDDVESEVRLALLNHNTVLLDMDPLGVKTYNLIQATIAVNAVDSERKDQDYLFHPRNTAHLQELVANISHVMFWHVVDSDLEERVRNAERSLENLEKRNGSPDDFELIKQSITHLRSAMSDATWIALQCQYHAFHRVHRIHPDVYEAWSAFPESVRKASPEALLPPTALTELRDAVTKRPLSSVAHIAHLGRTHLELEEAYRHFMRLQGQRKKKSVRDRSSVDSPPGKRKSFEAAKRESAKAKQAEMTREMEAALARLNAAFSGAGGDAKEADAPQQSPSAPSGRKAASSLLAASPARMADVRVRNSTSPKLDYILHEVLTYGKDEKFLIFSESPATLSFIAEAFDLFRIKHLSFSGQQNREERQSLITTFETSELYRVLLLELKYGARGLNLVSASRVIFCEPVWKADVESQAIKRVHRIGQTRSVVHVTTLAIRSTFEEVMVTRSKALRENKQEFAKAATDDRTIRDFIEHPVFLPVPTGDRLVDLDFPLFDIAPQDSTLPTFTSATSSRTDQSEVRAEIDGDHWVPEKKRVRRVAFAD